MFPCVFERGTLSCTAPVVLQIVNAFASNDRARPTVALFEYMHVVGVGLHLRLDGGAVVGVVLHLLLDGPSSRGCCRVDNTSRRCGSGITVRLCWLSANSAAYGCTFVPSHGQVRGSTRGAPLYRGGGSHVSPSEDR